MCFTLTFKDNVPNLNIEQILGAPFRQVLALLTNIILGYKSAIRSKTLSYLELQSKRKKFYNIDTKTQYYKHYGFVIYEKWSDYTIS